MCKNYVKTTCITPEAAVEYDIGRSKPVLKYYNAITGKESRE